MLCAMTFVIFLVATEKISLLHRLDKWLKIAALLVPVVLMSPTYLLCWNGVCHIGQLYYSSTCRGLGSHPWYFINWYVPCLLTLGITIYLVILLETYKC